MKEAFSTRAENTVLSQKVLLRDVAVTNFLVAIVSLVVADLFVSKSLPESSKILEVPSMKRTEYNFTTFNGGRIAWSPCSPSTWSKRCRSFLVIGARVLQDWQLNGLYA